MTEDPVSLGDEIIAELRENDGKGLRALLRALRENDDPESKALYEKLVRHPELSDLVPH